MSAVVLDGKAMAAMVRSDLAEAITGAGLPRQPGLAVVLVGENPASRIYVRNKIKACNEVGIREFEHLLAESVSESDLLALIAQLNADANVDGILVQLPLPGHIDERRIVEAVDPAKDVDGFHPANSGRLMAGLAGFVPCTPLGCLKLIKHVRHDLAGAQALVIGRSLTVGKPMALLLLHENCTVTMAHSRTVDLAEACRRADVLIAAAGKAELVKGDWIKPGAIVIDVGINRMPDGTIRGDVEFEGAAARAGAITPVPGGVGPMTIAYLLANTWKSFRLRNGMHAD